MAKTKFKVRGMREMLETLQTLPDKIAPQGGGPIDKALYKAANLWKEQAEENLIGLGPGIHSTKSAQLKRGHIRLKDSVIRRRDKEPETDGHYARVFVTTKPSAYWAPFVELGTEKQDEQSFLRTAMDQQDRKPIGVFRDSLGRDIERIVKRLAK